HMALRHSTGSTHGSPDGLPHSLSDGKQIFERHSASMPSHGSPLWRPQRLSSISQTDERHVRLPFAGVQLPSTGGRFGTCSPFGVFGMHTPCAHHSTDLHSLSIVHALPQTPAPGLQTGPSWPTQSMLFVHWPHAPVVCS